MKKVAKARLLRASVLCILCSALLVVAGLSVVAPAAFASAPQCYSDSGGGYCQYTGLVQEVYVNSSGFIIVYFDTAMNLSAPASVGISGVGVSNACAYQMSDNPDFAKMFYASALAAQSRGATVTIQLWGTTSGYLKCDRIWVAAS